MKATPCSRIIHCALVIMALFAPGCREDYEWSKEEKSGFMEDCLSGAENLEEIEDPEAYCRCYMKNLQKEFATHKDTDNLPLEEYQKYEKDCYDLARQNPRSNPIDTGM